MDDENVFGEQSEIIQPSLKDDLKASSIEYLAGEEIKQQQEASADAERGVPVGKFKSADDLLCAYNNLQAEFTRKSQRLAELEKDKAQSQSAQNTESELAAFLAINPAAAPYSEDLKTRVQQAALTANQEGFSKAWAGLLFDKLTGPDKASQPEVQNFILNDDELSNLVIKNYVKQLQENKTPIVMSSGSGQRVAKQATPKPENFEAAKRVVLDLFS